MQMTIVAWLVLELTDSPFMVALVGFFTWLPMLILGLFGGLLADWLNRAWLIRITHGAIAASALVITILLATDGIEVWHAYAVVLVTGIGNAVDQPARRALIHDFLGSSGVTNGLALESVAFSTSKILGPAVGGGVIAVAGVTSAYAVACGLFTVAALLVWMLQVVHESRGRWNARNVAADLVTALKYALRHPVLRAVLAITVIMNVFLFSYGQMIPVIARDVLHVGSALMGVLLASDGIGAFVGAIALASTTRITHHGLVFSIGSLVTTIALALLSFSQLYGLSVFSMVALGIGSAGFGTMQGAIVVLVSDHQMRGRALGMLSLAIGASPVGSLLVGAVASAINAPIAIRINAFIGLALIALVILGFRSIRGPIDDQ